MWAIPCKKMGKINDFVAVCDCGETYCFDKEDIDYNKSNASFLVFKEIYKCPQCGDIYDGIFENIFNRTNKFEENNKLIKPIIKVFLGVILLFGVIYFIDRITSPTPTTDINHATNQQLNDFYKWDQQQQQQKWENSPAFNNK